MFTRHIRSMRKSISGGIIFIILSMSLKRLGKQVPGESPVRTEMRSRLRMMYEALMRQGIRDEQEDIQDGLFPGEEYDDPEEAFTGLEELMFLDAPTMEQWNSFWMAMRSHPCGDHLQQQLELETMIFHTPWGWLLIRPDIANICMPYGDDPGRSLKQALEMIAQCAVREEGGIEDAEA